MAIVHEAKQVSQRGGPGAYGPAVVFTASVLMTFAALALATAALPKDFALAAISSLFFAFAALAALIAWCVGKQAETTLTYWDVAGALTLFGICAATLLDSDQIVRFIESQRVE